MATRYKKENRDNKDKDNKTIVITTSDATINDVCNTFIQDRSIDPSTATGFNAMLLNISNNIVMYDIDDKGKRDYSDINRLNYYFNIYTQLCAICGILPDITGFSVYSGIPYETISSWEMGRNRSTTHEEPAKKWRLYCKSVCVSSAGGGSVGAMYVSKAIHGLTDQPKNTYIQNNYGCIAPVSREAIAAEFGVELSDNTIDVETK